MLDLLDLGGLVSSCFLHFPSFPPQLDCLEKSLVVLLEQSYTGRPTGRSMSFYHLRAVAQYMARQGNKAGTFIAPATPAGISHPNLRKLDFAPLGLAKE